MICLNRGVLFSLFKKGLSIKKWKIHASKSVRIRLIRHAFRCQSICSWVCNCYETRSTSSWHSVMNQLSSISDRLLLEKGTGPSLHRWPSPCTMVRCRTQLPDAGICIRAVHHCEFPSLSLSWKWLHLLNSPPDTKLEERFTPCIRKLFFKLGGHRHVWQTGICVSKEREGRFILVVLLQIHFQMSIK